MFFWFKILKRTLNNEQMAVWILSQQSPVSKWLILCIRAIISYKYMRLTYELLPIIRKHFFSQFSIKLEFLENIEEMFPL